MLFNSFIFILIFLPISVFFYFALNKVNHRAAEIFLLAMSWWFYAYSVPAYLLVIISSIVVNFALSRLMLKSTGFRKKLILILGLAFDIGLIGYYKYLSFILWNFNTFFHADFVINSIVLPLGISFYTIQQISFLVDTYKGDDGRYDFVEYALYISFFPQLVAGPIVYHTEFLPKLRDEKRRTVNYENLVRGLMWFTLGLAKKVFLADRLGRAVEWGYSNTSAMNSADALLVLFAYTFQIYFDFSGYSDMACGIALMFNFELPQNFNSPYKSLSVRDFWKRWHMTLTRFLTAYIYVPLGGSKMGKKRLIINTMVVFLVSGIWHGANYTFILWGLLHGILLLINRFTERIWKKVPLVLRWSLNFFTVSILWALFRASGVKQWLLFLERLFSFDSRRLTAELKDTFDVYLPWWILMAASFVICLAFENNYNSEKKVTAPRVIACAALLGCCILTLNRTSIFLYFNF